jgi:hypothetical protein
VKDRALSMPQILLDPAGLLAFPHVGTERVCRRSQALPTPTVFAHKVRTITLGVELHRDDRAGWATALASALAFLSSAKARIEGLGLAVQTTRIVTNSFEEYCNCDTADSLCADVGALLSYLPQPCPVLVNIGPCRTPSVMAFVPNVVARHPVTCSAAVTYVDQSAACRCFQVAS